MTLSMSLPSFISTPRDCCAFIIRCVSSIKSGMKRSAILINIAISCAGTWNLFKGINKSSIPKVISKGFVVAVRHVVIIIINMSRIAIYSV